MVCRYAILTMCVVLAGCAGLDAGPERKSGDNGIRYYQTAPFLFVRSDGKGGLTSEIVYLPDTTLTMSVRPYAYLASNDATLSFSNGTLNEAKMIGDETVVPTAIIDAVSKAAAAFVGADQIGANASLNTVPVPVPYLFKIVVQKDRVVLIGGAAKAGAAKATINVNLVPQVSK
jgi:hypothetical protein